MSDGARQRAGGRAGWDSRPAGGGFLPRAQDGPSCLSLISSVDVEVLGAVYRSGIQLYKVCRYV